MFESISFLSVLVFFTILVVFKSVVIVKQGFNYTVERFGRFLSCLTPGMHFLIPFADRIGAKINMMEQVLDVPSQCVITKDNAQVKVDGVLFFQIIDAPKAAYQVSDLQDAMLNLAMTNIRTVMGSMDLDELLSMREVINVKLLDVVDGATHPWGIKVTRVEIKDIEPPADIVASMARQMKAERDKRALILEAEGSRQSSILEAEGRKQAAILEADGKREASFLEAEARERLAQAEATATQMVSKSIADGDIQAINYFVAQKYVEALATIGSAENQKVIFMPLEASNVIGSIGGISELLNASHMNKKSGK